MNEVLDEEVVLGILVCWVTFFSFRLNPALKGRRGVGRERRRSGRAHSAITGASVALGNWGQARDVVGSGRSLRMAEQGALWWVTHAVPFSVVDEVEAALRLG